MLANSSPRESRDGSPRCPKAAFDPPATSLDARQQETGCGDGVPWGVEERRDGSPPWRSEEAPAYPSYFLAASRRCSMMGMPWGQVTSQDPHWMQSDALPGSACHW